MNKTRTGKIIILVLHFLTFYAACLQAIVIKITVAWSLHLVVIVTKKQNTPVLSKHSAPAPYYSKIHE